MQLVPGDEILDDLRDSKPEDPMAGEPGHQILPYLRIERVNDEQSIEVIGAEDLLSLPVVLLAQHGELHAVRTLRYEYRATHLVDVGTQKRPKLAPGGFPIVLVLRLHNQARTETEAQH